MKTSRQLPVVPLSGRPAIIGGLIVLMAAGLIAHAIISTPIEFPVPIDYTTFGPPGARILTGQWSGIFADKIIQAGIFELVFWGVVFLLGVKSVAGWIVVTVVLGALLAVVIAWTVERLLRPITPAWSVTLGVVVATMSVITGLTTLVLTSGHPAEIAIPLMWIGAAMLARSNRPGWAAALLAATAGWELWGLLGIPLLLLTPRIDLRVVVRCALAGIAVIAALYLPFVLLGPFNMFQYGWRVRDNSLASLIIPSGERFPWPLRLTQGALALAGGAVVGIFARRRVEAVWLLPLVVCAIRLVADPVLANYYVAPPVVLCLTGAVMAVAHRSLPMFLACLVMLNVASDVPLSLPSACILVVLVLATAALLVRAARRGAVDGSFSTSPIST